MPPRRSNRLKSVGKPQPPVHISLDDVVTPGSASHRSSSSSPSQFRLPSPPPITTSTIPIDHSSPVAPPPPSSPLQFLQNYSLPLPDPLSNPPSPIAQSQGHEQLGLSSSFQPQIVSPHIPIEDESPHYSEHEIDLPIEADSSPHPVPTKKKRRLVKGHKKSGLSSPPDDTPMENPPAKHSTRLHKLAFKASTSKLSKKTSKGNSKKSVRLPSSLVKSIPPSHPLQNTFFRNNECEARYRTH